MSAYTGAQHKGARRAHRERKRAEAAERDARLPAHDPRRRQVRLAAERLTGVTGVDRGAEKLLHDLFGRAS